jgi:chromosome segregation ATPase
MLQCPICQTEYLEGLVNCSTCGWDLTPYLFTFQLPEAFIQKEQAKLNWAKAMWKQSQNQATLTHSEVEQLQAQILHLQYQLQQMEINLTLVKQERYKLDEQLKEKLKEIKEQSQLAQDLLSHWLPYLGIQLAQELSQIPDKYEAIKQINELIESSQQSQVYVDFYTNACLEIIKSILTLENLQQPEYIKRHFAEIAGNVNPIIQINSLLNARQELKLRGIIKRDIDGDTLYE